MKEVIPSSTSLYRYAEDHAIVDHFKTGYRVEELQCSDNIENCMINIKKWMDCNCFKINYTTTECIQFRNKRQLQKCHSDLM